MLRSVPARKKRRSNRSPLPEEHINLRDPGDYHRPEGRINAQALGEIDDSGYFRLTMQTCVAATACPDGLDGVGCNLLSNEYSPSQAIWLQMPD
jgi:hypothetical protein